MAGNNGRRRGCLGFIAVAIVGIAAASSATVVEATPAYGRRYGVACSTCHAPLPPRLNNVGILFRKLGFRMPDADDEGRLVIKPVAAHDIGEAASIVADVAGRRDKEAEFGESPMTFELSEVELVAGTAIGDRVSAQRCSSPGMTARSSSKTRRSSLMAGACDISSWREAD